VPEAVAPPEPVALPAGVTAGHWTDREAWTGCTVVLLPEGGTAAAEVRGGGPGTREFDLLGPAANVQGVSAVLLTGGSAFGLAAADGVVAHLAERGVGYATPVGRVPLVPAAVVFDLGLGDPAVRPGPAEGRAAAEAASPELERGSVGAGTGCTAGKLFGLEGWTKGGLGAATLRVDGALLTAIAVVNAIGDVLGPDGAVLAGGWRDGGYVRATERLRAGERPRPPLREATTLVLLLTDAALAKREAWLLARAGTSGVARAIDPSATPHDGDAVICAATGAAEADPFALAALAGTVTELAIRDAVLQATGAPGCPAVRDRRAAAEGSAGPTR
jgi:L-aminopeptidase/D-esterase-like protein